MQLVLTGATGLIGSRFEELMFETHHIIPLSTSHGVDITDKESVWNYLSDKQFDAIIHLAGKTDVDGCELDKTVDMQLLETTENALMDIDVSGIDPSVFKGKTTAVAINTIGTKNLYEAAKEKSAKFIYISTDFVFPGTDEFYTEESKPLPVDWYGMSKYLGERVVAGGEDLIVRLSFPYGYQSPVKKDLVWKLHDLLSQKDEVNLISDQIITPTFIDDIVNGLDLLLTKNARGVYHLTGSNYLSPFIIGQKIREVFGFPVNIGESKLLEVYAGKAPRPFQSRMKHDKLDALGFKPKTFEEGLALISTA